MRRVMVATDGSAGANRAMDVAIELAKAVESELLIVTVGSSLSTDEVRRLVRAERDVGDVLESQCNEILSAAETKARHKGISKVTSRTGWGDPAEVILKMIETETVDMIVLGRRGHGQLMGLLLGSVSQKIVSLARCVVVVVP